MNKAFQSLIRGNIAAIHILCLVLSGCAENKRSCTLPREFIYTGDVPGFPAEVYQARRKKLMKDMQAEIEYVFLKNGLRPGFQSITGSGPNAAILHYTGNDRTMLQNDLLLMDIGAACGGYSADVTRTIPVSGRFTPGQKEIYELVLKAQEEAIELMVPGNRILSASAPRTIMEIEQAIGRK